MDIPGQSFPEPIPDNNGASNVHNAEQMWAEASAQLDKIIAYGAEMLPLVYANAGGNTDISVVYDWWKAYIQLAEEQGERVASLLGANRNGAHDMTVLMCAAAITRLMRATDPRMIDAGTVLAQLERDMTDDDDH